MNNSKDIFIKAEELIDQSKIILIAGHKDPDGDSVGSMLAMANYLKSRKKDYYLYTYDKPPNYLSFLPLFEEIKTTLPKKEFDLLIALDYGNFYRLKISDFIPSAAKILSIDHHEFSDQKGDVVILNPSADSTCQMVYSFFKENKITISDKIAECIFCGIMADTGVCQYQNTEIQTFESIVALLQSYQFDWKRIIRETTYCKRTINTMKLWARILDRLERDDKSIMAYTYITRQDFKDFKLPYDQASGLTDLIKTATDVKFVMLLKNYFEDGFIEVSMRSDDQKDYDTAKLAALFGGGGHKYASGFKMQGTIDEVIKKVKDALKKHT